MADYALSEHDFPFHYEKVLQQLFSIAAIVPSGLLMLIILLPQETAHASIHMPIPTYTGAVNALRKASQAAYVRAIPKRLDIDDDGTPLCAAGFRMVYSSPKTRNRFGHTAVSSG